MRTGCAAIAAMLLLGACGYKEAQTWYDLKARCAAGDYTVCADLGHLSREAMGGTTEDQALHPLSTPIVD